MFFCASASRFPTRKSREAVDQGARTIGDISASLWGGRRMRQVSGRRAPVSRCLFAGPAVGPAIDSTIDPDGGRGHAAAPPNPPSAGGLVCRGLMISRRVIR